MRRRRDDGGRCARLRRALPALITVRHARASGRLDSFWDLNHDEPVIVVRVITGHGRHMDLSIPVCSMAHPRFGAYVLSRQSEDVWLIHPAKVVASGDVVHARIESLLASEAFTLTNTPVDVSTALEAL